MNSQFKKYVQSSVVSFPLLVYPFNLSMLKFNKKKGSFLIVGVISILMLLIILPIVFDDLLFGKVYCDYYIYDYDYIFNNLPPYRESCVTTEGGLGLNIKYTVHNYQDTVISYLYNFMRSYVPSMEPLDTNNEYIHFPCGKEEDILETLDGQLQVFLGLSLFNLSLFSYTLLEIIRHREEIDLLINFLGWDPVVQLANQGIELCVAFIIKVTNPVYYLGRGLFFYVSVKAYKTMMYIFPGYPQFFQQLLLGLQENEFIQFRRLINIDRFIDMLDAAADTLLERNLNLIFLFPGQFIERIFHYVYILGLEMVFSIKLFGIGLVYSVKLIFADSSVTLFLCFWVAGLYCCLLVCSFVGPFVSSFVSSFVGPFVSSFVSSFVSWFVSCFANSIKESLKIYNKIDCFVSYFVNYIKESYKFYKIDCFDNYKQFLENYFNNYQYDIKLLNLVIEQGPDSTGCLSNSIINLSYPLLMDIHNHISYVNKYCRFKPSIEEKLILIQYIEMETNTSFYTEFLLNYFNFQL